MRIVNFQEKWIPMEHPDVPLNKEQFTALCNGCDPGWEARYATIALGGGWFYTYRSGWLLEKFRYEKGDDGIYHLVEFFHKSKGYDNPPAISGVSLSYYVCCALYEGDYDPSLRDFAVEFMKKMKT